MSENQNKSPEGGAVAKYVQLKFRLNTEHLTLAFVQKCNCQHLSCCLTCNTGK